MAWFIEMATPWVVHDIILISISYGVLQIDLSFYLIHTDKVH